LELHSPEKLARKVYKSSDFTARIGTKLGFFSRERALYRANRSSGASGRRLFLYPNRQSQLCKERRDLGYCRGWKSRMK
jgi:hypothetical protein